MTFRAAFLFLFTLGLFGSLYASLPPEAESDRNENARKNVYVVRLNGEIGTPSQFILRRALKEAIGRKADIFVLDLNTPGGSLDSMLKSMEALVEFPGRTITYINAEAVSAGSYLASVTDEIWFAPKGIMGAADVVSGDGADVGATMKLKLHSYIDGRVRSLTEGKGEYRSIVQRAMMDADYELKIGDTVIKPKGSLLSLTANEAVKTYGDPPQALLAAGIAPDLDTLLREVCGDAERTVHHFEENWAEHLALLIQWLAPLLLAAAGICAFVEYKTPGFGIFGITAAVLFFIVFTGNYAAGLAGYEPLALLLLGVALIAVECVFFPGTYIALTAGFACMLGGLFWSMADVWPGKGLDLSGADLVRPVAQLSVAALLLVGGGFALWRFLPRRLLHNRLVLDAVVDSMPVSPGLGADILSPQTAAAPAEGDTGVAVTDLRLAGVVEIGGVRYNATASSGMVARGTKVVITVVGATGLAVEPAADQ
ncbi:MAG: hypothetical protein LBV54_02640 [Puniceicoccales bacterium]|jgi:membrane-bound serine protease (ClpP class)|nr:hypothetical protein [Puniceicoccales bacterium]